MLTQPQRQHAPPPQFAMLRNEQGWESEAPSDAGIDLTG
jgi:hypothetical protein